MLVELAFNEFPGGEWCGDAAEVRAQQQLARESAWLSTQPRLLSQGRTLLVFDGHRFGHQSLGSLVKKFRRMLIHARRPQLPEISDAMRGIGAGVDDRLQLVRGEKPRVLDKLSRLDYGRRLPPGWTLEGLDASSPAALVSTLQQLYLSSGITPLPGGFIRGVGVQAHTLVLYDERKDVVGCATVQSLSGCDSAFDAAAMVLGVCLRSDARGRGLSLPLNGAALTYGIEKFDACRVYELIEEGNRPSLRMNEACGLEPDNTDGFVFASVPPG
jgi:hypothetical protein